MAASFQPNKPTHDSLQHTILTQIQKRKKITKKGGKNQKLESPFSFRISKISVATRQTKFRMLRLLDKGTIILINHFGLKVYLNRQ